MPLIGLNKVKTSIGDVYLEKNRQLRAIYLTAFSSIIKGTPVDEGRTRNNWFLSVMAPSTKVTNSKSSGLSTISSLRAMPTKVLNNKIYLTNNFPSIVPLEYGEYPQPGTDKTINGFSTQAPKGWVRAELIKARNRIRKL